MGSPRSGTPSGPPDTLTASRPVINARFNAGRFLLRNKPIPIVNYTTRWTIADDLMPRKKIEPRCEPTFVLGLGGFP